VPYFGFRFPNILIARRRNLSRLFHGALAYCVALELILLLVLSEIRAKKPLILQYLVRSSRRRPWHHSSVSLFDWRFSPQPVVH